MVIMVNIWWEMTCGIRLENFGEILDILGWLLNQLVKKWRCLQYDHLNGKMINLRGTLMIVMDIHRYLSSNIKTHHEEHCNNHFNTASIHQFGFLINRSWGTSSNKQQGGTLWQLKSLNSVSPVEILTICARVKTYSSITYSIWFMVIHQLYILYMVYGLWSSIFIRSMMVILFLWPCNAPFYGRMTIPVFWSMHSPAPEELPIRHRKDWPATRQEANTF